MAQVPEQVPHAPENPVAEAIIPQNPVAEPPVPPPPVVENAANAENLEVFLLHSSLLHPFLRPWFHVCLVIASLPASFPFASFHVASFSYILPGSF